MLSFKFFEGYLRSGQMQNDKQGINELILVFDKYEEIRNRTNSRGKARFDGRRVLRNSGWRSGNLFERLRSKCRLATQLFAAKRELIEDA